MTQILLFCLMYFGAQTHAQKGFDYSKLHEFTKSPTEHIINELEHPIEVRSVRGFITYSGGHPLANAIFEIREKSSDAVRKTITNGHGRFSIRRVAEGIYDFKATLDGFQSVVGTIVVSKQAGHTAKIHIEMHVGV